MEKASVLFGKVAVVTGASSGIGEATTIALVKEGVKVAAVARRMDRLKALKKKYASEPGEILPIGADVSDEIQVHDAVAKTLAKWKHIDVLFANAGINRDSPVLQANTSDWRQMINVNLLGVLYSVHEVVPIMTKQKNGHIVTTSSVAGRAAIAGNSVYCATKWGVRAFSEALRKEVLADNIRVTVIEPGAVDTEIIYRITNPDTKANMESLFRSVKILESQDIANAVLYALKQPDYACVCEILIRPTAAPER